MSKVIGPYQTPMEPHPILVQHARTIRFSHSDRTVFCFDAGGVARPAVLLVHGLGDEADTWRHVIPDLAQHYRVLAPDLPGFGRSEPLAGRYSLDALASTQLELLDAVGVSQAVIAGHSLGAMLCHLLALRHPERVVGLALISGGLCSLRRKVDLQSLLFLIPGVGEWLYNRLRQDPHAAYASLEPFYHDLGQLAPEERAFLFQRVNQRVWSDRQRRAFFSTLRSIAGTAGQFAALSSQVAGLAVPTVICWGEADRVNPVDNARALVQAQPAARLVTVPNAGHNLQQEAPQEVVKAIAALAAIAYPVTE